MLTTTAALTFTGLIAVVILFQIAMAGGAPWGHLAMGGRYPGQFPPPIRVAAIAQAILLGCFAWVILIRAQVIDSSYYEMSKIAVWVVVAFMTLSLIMQLVTPSKWERILWAPIVALMLACACMVGMS